MKFVKGVFLLALIAGSVYAGVRAEETYIKMTCDDDDAATVLNGVSYVCLDMETANALRQRLHDRGA